MRQSAEVRQALDELISSETPFVRTPSIQQEIDLLKDLIDKWDASEKISWNPDEEPSSEKVRKVVLNFSNF
jgi:hypothetical protein